MYLTLIRNSAATIEHVPIPAGCIKPRAKLGEGHRRSRPNCDTFVLEKLVYRVDNSYRPAIVDWRTPDRLADKLLRLDVPLLECDTRPENRAARATAGGRLTEYLAAAHP